MKLGIVGAGMIVKEFLPRLIKIEGLEVLGILGVPAELDTVKELCQTNNVTCATTDFDALCNTGIDTVYVAVPNFLHYDYCKKALEKGLHVIVEKPITSNLREAQTLKALADEKGLFIFEAVTTPYLGNYKKIKEWLPLIGDIKIVQSHYSQYSSRYNAFKDGQVLPAFDPKKAGGALMDLNLYNIHYVMGLFGKPDNVKYYANIERNIDTSGMLVMEYPDFIATCIGAKDCKGCVGGTIQGTKGVIKSAMSANLIGEVILQLNDGTIESFDDFGYANRLIPEFTAFIQAINTNDIDFYQKQMQESLDVCEIQTKARLEAGIIFPADE